MNMEGLTVKQLDEICENVYYYPRKMRSSYLFHKLPFIVVSRASKTLKKRLLNDEHPILFEGLHTCYFLNDEHFKTRLTIVRTHNIEHDYYEHLARVEKNIFKKTFFLREAEKLKSFEANLQYAKHILAISDSDRKALQTRHPQVSYLPAFHPGSNLEQNNNIGNFCLYHGNLAVGENQEAALYLINEVFSTLSIPLIIAGNKPTKALINRINKFDHIHLLQNPNQHDMRLLIEKAQINILPTFQATGIKLKLLLSLHWGKHCIVNQTMVNGTKLDQLCTITTSTTQMQSEINNLFERQFSALDKSKRATVLNNDFSNEINATSLIDLLGSLNLQQQQNL